MLLAITALAVWMVWPAFSPGRIVNLDAPRHLLRSMVMAEQFLPSGHVDGWSPWWYLGAQLFLFQSYGYFFLIGGSAWLLSPWVGIGELFKLWYVLPVVALPAATAFLALRLGVSRGGAAAAALASVTFESPLGYGMQGMFGIGLLLQGVGIVGFALVWPEVLRTLRHPCRAPWAAMVMLAALLVLHFISGFYALVASGGVALGLALRSRSSAPLIRYAMIAAVVLVLAGHTLFLSLELRDLAGSAVGWGEDRDRLSRFLSGTLFGGQRLAVWGLVAAVWSLWRANTNLAISAMVFLVTALFGGSHTQSWEPKSVAGLLDVLVRPRALPYVALFQAVFVGVAFQQILHAFAFVGQRLGRPGFAQIGAGVVSVVLLFAAFPELSSARRSVITESMLKPHDRVVYSHMVDWFEENVTPPAIAAVPRDLFPTEAIGARSVISLFNMDTGLYTLSGDQAELTRPLPRTARVDLDRLDERPNRNAALLRDAGVSYVVLTRSGLRKRLLNIPAFELVYEYEAPVRKGTPLRGDGTPKYPRGVSIYRLRGGGTLLHGPNLKVVRQTCSPERISWLIQAADGSKPRLATAAVNWHPDWKASVDGVATETIESRSRRISFEIPAGASQVTLAFERRAQEKVWNLLSAVTLLWVLLQWFRSKRRVRSVGNTGETRERR